MDVTLHILNDKHWMEIVLEGKTYFGQAGRWHLVNDNMKYLLNNSDIQALDRIYYVQEAKLIYGKLQKLDESATEK